MKCRLIFLGVLGTSASASAQIDFALPFQAYRVVQERGLITPKTINPLQPKLGSDLNPPVPKTPVEKLPEFKLIHAGKQRKVGNKINLEQGCEFLVRGYYVTADRAIGDLGTSIFTLFGHVTVDGNDLTVRGEEVTVDFKQQSYTAKRSKSTLPPVLVQGKLKDNLYVSGETSAGTASQTRTKRGDLTTCSLDHPHYEILSEDSDVKTGKRAIFRDAKIKVFGKTIFTVPYLAIPLDDRTYRYLPTVGQTEDEGFFIKERYAIPLKGNDYLDTREEYLSKLGLGLGADYVYNRPEFSGITKVYGIIGKARTFSLSNSHRQQLKWGTLTFDNDYQKNNYLSAPGSTVLNTRATLSVPQGGEAVSRFSFSRNSSESTGYSTVNQSIGVNDTRRFSGGLRSNLDLNLTQSQNSFSSGSSERQQLDVRFRGDQDLRSATASLEYQRAIPIGTVTGFGSAADRTPVLTLQSDARRLFGDKLAKAFPFQTDLSWGEYQGSGANGRISRLGFGFRFNKVDTSKSRLTADVNSDFRQAVYSDDTAQYTLNLGSNVRYSLGKDTGVNLRYNYLRPYGFSPLQLDRVGRSNYVSLDVNVKPLPSYLIGLQTGYDIQQLEQRDTPWQQVGVRMEYRPSKKFLGRGLFTYDTVEQLWRSVRLDLSYSAGETQISFGSRYDGARHTWSNANLFLDNIRSGKTTLSAILSYNGYLKQFDSRQYNLTYDLHCWEAVLSIQENSTGFRSGRQIFFFLRIKAIPFEQPFGIGTRGQPFGTGTGSDF